MSEYNEMYMRLAMSVAPMSGCLSGQVGSVLVIPDLRGVVVPAYNVPPPGKKSCVEMGECQKQWDGKKYRCVNTVHAEIAALQLACACHFTTEGAVLYVTKLPCHSCGKVLAQFGIAQVFYLHDNTSLGSIGFNVLPSICFEKVEVPI